MNIKDNKGITGVDVAVATVVIIVFLSTITAMFYNVSTSSKNISRKAEATNIAVDVIEKMKQAEFEDLVVTGETRQKLSETSIPTLTDYTVANPYDVEITVEDYKDGNTVKIITAYVTYKVNKKDEEVKIQTLKKSEDTITAEVVDEPFIPSDTPEERPEEDTTDTDGEFARNNGVIEVEFLSGATYNTTQTANAPKLGEGMKAVYWEEDGTEVVEGSANFDTAKWYDYVAQTAYTTTGGTSKWANAITEDGSYWVWIPRYAYRIVYFDTAEHAESYRFGNLSEEEALNNGYLLGYSDARGMVYADGLHSITNISDKSTAIAVNEKKFRTHPAFEDNVTNGGWDSKLTGIWVAKYEMSMETNGTATTTSSLSVGNVLTSSTVKAVSKPGVTSWRYIYVGNMYTNSYNYNRNLESHLMKNSEWGAVAYLTDSKYGRQGTEITINSNSSYYTGGGTESSYKTNVLQSTTGNIYGIYDLSGGAREYTAIYDSSPSTYSYLSTYGLKLVSENPQSTKYCTLYENTSSTYSGDFTLGKVSYLGDALQEIFISGTTGWYSDYVDFISTSYPFLTRGGYYDGGARAGVFYSCSCFGDDSYDGDISFRAVLCP